MLVIATVQPESVPATATATARLVWTCPDDRGVVDDAYVEAAAEEAIAVVRGRGRPSLSSTGESPLPRVRIPRDLDEAVRAAAQRSGTSRSEWVRRALDDADRRAG